MIIFMISTKHLAEIVEARKKDYVCDKPMVMHLTQCHSPEPSNILIRQRLRHEMQKKEEQADLA